MYSIALHAILFYATLHVLATQVLKEVAGEHLPNFTAMEKYLLQSGVVSASLLHSD